MADSAEGLDNETLMQLLKEKAKELKQSQKKLKKVEDGNEEYDYGRYPYVDTFRRYDPKTGILINDEEQGSDEEGCYILESTSGYYTEVEGGYWSEWHDRMIPEDEAIRSDIYNDWLYRDQAITVERGSRTGVYHQDDDYITYDEKLEEYIHQDDAVFAVVCR